MDPFAQFAMPSWPSDALCTQVGYADLWHPDKGGTPYTAEKVCARCPIVASCLTYALANREHGVWGATTAIERDVLTGRRSSSRKANRATVIARLATIGVDVEAILRDLQVEVAA